MKKLAIFMLLWLPVLLAGQTETVFLQWESRNGKTFFPHALYEDGDNTLPYYTRVIPWDHPGMLPVVSVEVLASSPLEGLPPDRSSLLPVDTPDLEYSLAWEKGRGFVVLKLLPFFRREGGIAMKVESFRIQLEKKAALAPLKSRSTGSWAGHSVLSSGNWFRVSVEQGGMHGITYEQLKEMGMENPASVRVYGTGARLLPENFSLGYVDDLPPVPIYMDKGSDGLFGPGDHILFYAEGPVSWTFDSDEAFFIHGLHDYSWLGYYFLTDSKGPAGSPGNAALSTADPVSTVTSYDFRDHLEEETYNLLKSGKEWYGDIFSVNLEYDYPFVIPGQLEDEPVGIRVVVAARSGTISSFQVSANGGYLGSIQLSGTDLSHYTYTYAYEKAAFFTLSPGPGEVTLSLEYNRPDNNSEGWLNNMTVNGRCRLAMEEDELAFRDHRSALPGNISRFLVEVSGEPVIWDVSDPSNPLNVPYSLEGDYASFTLETNEIREFIAFMPGGSFPSPAYSGPGLGAIENQDLHGLQHPDMVIVTPELFLEQANRLAEHRATEDGLRVEVVLQQQVFNEFSSGTPDVSAIRNFMKMFYDRSGGTGSACRYLLLFGDGSYCNRTDPGKVNNPNLIITYQSYSSLEPTRSYVSDDFFGLLDTGEGLYDGLLDIGIGRLPASTPEEAEELVDKLIGYDDLTRQGDWRNQLCFIGDDEDANTHMKQADQLATYVSSHYPAYNINKIYLDAYQQVKGASGDRYPDVTMAINNQVNRGALVVNYTGHGGPSGLAHEQVVTEYDINSWSNEGMLSLFMTATCEFSRYDAYDNAQDQEETSAGEKVLLNNNGGGIGLFTTTRLVYSQPNHVLNEKFFEVVFEKDDNQQNYRLGDIIVYSKNNTGSGINKRNFTLLGDPSTRLAYPEHRVVTDSINGVETALLEDTLSAFNWMTVSGHLERQDGTFMEGFNGTVYPMVFDKEKEVEILTNDDGPAWSFKARNNILYSGKATVKDGRFSFGFYVPKDINYAYGTGKISYYSNDSLTDAHGSCEAFTVGGIGTENAVDLEPPVIELFMNDTFFKEGGITDPSPTLLVLASDNFGINTTGNGIGHDLTAFMDDSRVDAAILNEFFQANTDSYNSGIIRYPYSNLEQGKHVVTVKIWDIHNNSTLETLEFLVVDAGEMLLEELFNYPNPFSDLTLFNIEHNRPDMEMRLVIHIFNMSGELVKTIDRQVYSSGYRLEPPAWDGTGAGGAKLGSGIYLYRAILSTPEGERATDSGKLVLVR